MGQFSGNSLTRHKIFSLKCVQKQSRIIWEFCNKMPGGNFTNYKFYKLCTQQNFSIIHLKDDAWYHSICFEAFTHHSISYHKKTYPCSIQSGYDGIFIYGFFFINARLFLQVPILITQNALKSFFYLKSRSMFKNPPDW